jgi:hypothetical protein
MKIYNSNTDLFKIEDFKGLNYSKTNYDCWTKDWKQFLKDNQEFKNLLKKVGKYIFEDDNKIEKDMFCDFQILGDLNKDLEKVYFQIDNQGSICLVEDLGQFSENYNTEEDWRIRNWIQM